MNKVNRLIRQLASTQAVRGFRPEGKSPRPARSYRAARRNLARALCGNAPWLSWPKAWDAAQKATADSLRYEPADLAGRSMVRVVTPEPAVAMVDRSEVEGSPEPVDSPEPAALAEPAAEQPDKKPRARRMALAGVGVMAAGVAAAVASSTVADATDVAEKPKRIRKPKVEAADPVETPVKPARKRTAKAA